MKSSVYKYLFVLYIAVLMVILRGTTESVKPSGKLPELTENAGNCWIEGSVIYPDMECKEE